MKKIDHERFSDIVRRLYDVVADLESMFPGQHFTPDGHMVGSLGECLVADAFDLTLMEASNKGFDAEDPSGKRVEIKATQSTRVSFRSCPDYTIIIRINPDGTFETCYNGPGSKIWNEFKSRKRPSNGQYSIALSRVRDMNREVPDHERISQTPNPS